jgi:hypothetical protein
MSASPEPGKRSFRKVAIWFPLAMVFLIALAAWAYFAHRMASVRGRKASIPATEGSAENATATNASAPETQNGTAPETEAGPRFAVEPIRYDADGYPYPWPGEEDCAEKPILWGDSLSGNPTPVFLSAFAANWLAHYFPLDSQSVGMEKFSLLGSALRIQDKPVSCMYSDTLNDVPLQRLRFHPGFFRAMLELPDSTVSRIKSSFDSVLSGQTLMPDLFEKLLVAKSLLESNPQLREAFEFMIDKRIKFDRVDWFGFVGMTYSDSLGRYFRDNSEYFYFWLDRYEDHTVELADSLLARIAQRYAFGKTRAKTIPSKIRSIFHEPPPDKSRTRVSGVFFDPKSFIDPSMPPDSSRLDIRRKISRKFILSSALSLATFRETDIKALMRGFHEAEPRSWQNGWISSSAGKKLSDFLFNSGSKYFDSNLAYYGFIHDRSKNSYAWEPIDLAPKLEITGYSWDDGVYDLGIQLSPYPAHAGKKNPILFAGVPAQERPRPIPTGGRAALLLSRRVDAIQDSDYCRKATEIYAIPEGIKLRSLFTKTFYAARFESASYIEKLEGQNRDGLVFANVPDPVRRSPDTTANSVLQAKAVLYLVTPSQDTVLLYTDQVEGAIADGETVYSQAARCRTPVFTDADGDGLEDLLFETSAGQALFLQRKDGSFKQRIF